ncbi:hypothetical protein [Janibacter sp. G1551]|uniref:hypothetical protein n=1 Tax=Janibacter sp. G1551 TaxID=3420440 RepID=UPI003D0339EC
MTHEHAPSVAQAVAVVEHAAEQVADHVPEPAKGAAEAVVQPRAWRWHLLVTFLWAVTIWGSTVLDVSPVGHAVAASAHVIGMTLALGAVMLIDWYGLVWLSGLRTFRENLRLADAAHPIIWFGLVLLLTSGLFLHPDLGSAQTWVKLAAVLVLVNNGVATRSLGRRLAALGRPKTLADLPSRTRYRTMVAIGLSQACWWIAAGVGFLTSSGTTLG